MSTDERRGRWVAALGVNGGAALVFAKDIHYVPHSCGLMLSVGFSKCPIRIQLTMKPATTSREKRAAFISPLLFYIIAE
jgi:hypothetical protein